MRYFNTLALSVFIAAGLHAQTAPTVLWDLTPTLFNANTQWTATGFQLSVGDTFAVHVEGFASAWHANATDSRYWFGPDGWGDNIAPSGAGWPLPGVPSCAVIGRIGDGGSPFFVGKNRIFNSNESGELYLGYNDNQPSDNFGTFIAFVSVHGIYRPTGTGVAEQPENLGREYKLSQNYPNPFNPSTTISYVLSSRANVEVQIFDMAARLVKTLVSEQQESGSHTVVWNGQDQAGHSVASGTYFYRVDSDGRQLAKKMLLLK